MVKKNILLLNGPPRSGKDTLAKQLVDQYGFAHFKITSRWKERVHALYGMDPLKFPHDHFEAVKDTPQGAFYGLTPRQAYIEVWEKYFLPKHGENVLMDWLIGDIDNSPNENIVISDVGFDRECKYLFQYYGKQCLLTKIFRSGYNFVNDTRDYVKRDSAILKIGTSKIDRHAVIFNSREPHDMVNELKFIWSSAFTTPLIPRIEGESHE